MSTIQKHPTYTFKPPADAIKLPGFVERGVTYQSHTFYVAYGPYRPRQESVVYVQHGGGWESINLRHMTTTALKALLAAENTRAAFFLCWELFEIDRNSSVAASHAVAKTYREAFAEGRLKKRKMPGRDACKIWIEDRPPTPVPPERLTLGAYSQQGLSYDEVG